MNRTIVGALLIVLIVVTGAVGTKLLLPVLESHRQKATSDAATTKGKIRVAMDNWIGYFIIGSPEMASAMRRAGYLLECQDDAADYDRRMARLKSGDIDMAVATVDAFLLSGARHHFPGTIVMVIDESKGGDAILARKEKIDRLEAMRGKTAIRVAYTPDSPSHFLAKATAEHFNIPEMLPEGDRMVATDGSHEAMQRLLAGQADVAVCWEPDVSRALAEEGIVKILGTEDTRGLIVDVLVASREMVRERPEAIEAFLTTYFRVLKTYRENRTLLIDRVMDRTRLGADVVDAMLEGVRWVNFGANCDEWFGISAPGTSATEGVVETIMASVRILENAGDFPSDPLPDGDPFRLTNRGFLKALSVRGIDGAAPLGSHASMGGDDTLTRRFSYLTDEGWDRLKAVGTLKMDPIVFQRGTAELDPMAQQVVDVTVARLRHYPAFRVMIQGHTSIRGDADENLRLSQDRADAVARYLATAFKMDPNRIRVVGRGGTRPLAKAPGESRRSWLYRLPRVELTLVKEDI